MRLDSDSEDGGNLVAGLASVVALMASVCSGNGKGGRGLGAEVGGRSDDLGGNLSLGARTFAWA